MYQRSYHAKVLNQKAPPEKKRRNGLPWRRISWIVGGIAFAGVLMFFIRWHKLQVDNIEVTGTHVADPEDVSLFIQSQIEGDVLYFFPKSSMLLVPTASLAKWTARQFPRFASVDIRRKGLHSLSVTIVEHEGRYLWCETETSCFFMTKEGIVFAEAPFFSGDAYKKIFLGERGEQLPFSPITDEQLRTVELLFERLPSIGINPTELRGVSVHQVDVFFSHHGQVARLMIDPESGIDAALEDLATGLAAEPLKGLFKNEQKVLEYLDARFANKLIYKFQ